VQRELRHQDTQVVQRFPVDADALRVVEGERGERLRNMVPGKRASPPAKGIDRRVARDADSDCKLWLRMNE
jgi:hypothetical protein